MTAPNARLGFGTVLTFLTSGVEIELLDFDWESFKRAVIDTSHHGTTLANGTSTVASRTKIPGKLVEAGDVKCEGHYTRAGVFLIEKVRETIRVTLPLESGETVAEKYEFTGFAYDVKPFKSDLDGKMMLSFTLAVSGNVTPTAAT